MNADAKRIPSSSQTVGPYFRIGLEYLVERTPAIEPGTAGTIEIRGRVLDRDGAPVPDAMLEFWCASDAANHCGADANDAGFPGSFRRSATDLDGSLSVLMSRPGASALDDGRMQAPHMVVLVFTRGLLRHLISRVYFEDEPGNESDPVMLAIPAERRRTLIARLRSPHADSYHWDVILQGRDETVFFAW